ncbi:rho GTPase-activating protein 31 isoform X2 [Genypterus blacodes]
MKNKGSKLKSKKKGSENAFGCDLTEHLQSSGHDVPQVLVKCAEFIEKHGVVDGIYRLSGVTSNIQRLRQEFSSEACPDLTKEVYLQDIHCVGSLCKLYFRELPNPLLTYELYGKFTEAVLLQGDHEKLLHLQRVIKELPVPHFRTLQHLTKHLTHLATLSTQTNMHTRNLALVWAPNLLRSKHIETSSANGDMAFQEVRVQQSVVEFILNHTEQIFSNECVQIKPKEGVSLMCGEKYATLPISGQGGPMKLMSLEEAQARSLSPNHPVHKERQRENSLPDTSTATLYHTVIDLSDSKRKLSGKSKRWKSIFNLGKSGTESKGKLSRNGSVFIRAQGITEKAALRPSRSMESLCSLPTDDDRTGHSSPAGGSSSIFVPDVKSRTLGSDSLYDLSDKDQRWEYKGKKVGGATGGWSPTMTQKGPSGASPTPQKTLPEQLKVFKGDDLSGYRPTSPKNRRMLYSGSSSSSSSSSSSRPSFPGSFFPLESSPRHQRRAVNISEPFAVSVPLRVSAVISSNSTPCRGHAKDKAVSLKPCKEPGANTFPAPEPKNQEEAENKNTLETTSSVTPEDTSREVRQEGQGGTSASELEQPPVTNTGEGKDAAGTPGKHEDNQPGATTLEKSSSYGNELWSDLHQELKITEPEIGLQDETSKPADNVTMKTTDVRSKRSSSSPSLTLLCKEQTSSPTGSNSATKKQPSESDTLFSLRKNSDALAGGSVEDSRPAEGETESKQDQIFSECTSGVDTKQDKSAGDSLRLSQQNQVLNSTQTDDSPKVGAHEESEKPEIPQDVTNISFSGLKTNVRPEVDPVPRRSVSLDDRRNTLELPHLDDDEGCGGNPEELDLVEPWEDLTSTKQWVTSPLHSPEVEDLFTRLPPFSETLSSVVEKITSLSFSANKHSNRSSVVRSAECLSGNTSQASCGKPDTKGMYLPSLPTRSNAAGSSAGKCSSTKQKNTASSQRFCRQMSYETERTPENREGNCLPKHRPYSLNLDLGHRCIRDISNQQSQHSSEFPSCPRVFLSPSGALNNGPPSELELFLSDRQAPLRRNSAPVSVSSVRTAFMIKTCQAKAVPVVPPKVQYSQIPHSRRDNDSEAVKERDKEHPKANAEKSGNAPPQSASDLKEELENKEPAPKHQRHPNTEKPECAKTTSTPELPVITRRHAPNLEVFVDCPRPSRTNVLQRPSFRNRQRPQSLILLSPPFPIMDYPSSGDDGKLLSSIKSLNDTSAMLSKEMAENYRAPEGMNLQNKMTIPKSGQRLETSTSCFYQPQRRSMIFDSRSQRQIE